VVVSEVVLGPAKQLNTTSGCRTTGCLLVFRVYLDNGATQRTL